MTKILYILIMLSFSNICFATNTPIVSQGEANSINKIAKQSQLSITNTTAPVNTANIKHNSSKKNSAGYCQRSDVKKFIGRMVAKYQFDKKYLCDLFNKVKTNTAVLQCMNKPYESKPWYVYEKSFITPERIQGGVVFWHTHADCLKRAEKKYGIPPEIIVAIIGIESKYGHNTGGFGVFNTLATLAFNYPRRSQFFQKELAEYLLMAKEENFDPLSLKGSYAGAIGQPQFMPSSYRHYAVDFSGNGKRDLFFNVDDIIGSVANYLAENGWQRGEPVLTEAQIKGDKTHYKKFIGKNSKPKYKLKQLNKAHIIIKDNFAKEKPATLLMMVGPNKEKLFWVTFNNFYTITRYNTSPLYAMAVYSLGSKIADAYHQSIKSTQ